MELNKSISYKELMTNILPNKLKKYMSEDTLFYLIEIFTPNMEDNETLSYTLSEWIKYFIDTSLEVIRDIIKFEDNKEDVLDIYDRHEKVMSELYNTLIKLINEQEKEEA